MNLDTIKAKSLSNQTWLERALLVLDEGDHWRGDDERHGRYLAGWVRSQLGRNVKLGQCITADYWLGRARNIVQRYDYVLLQLAYDKAVAEAKAHERSAAEARELAYTLRREMDSLARQMLDDE